jgi:hypothetical protein
MPHTMVSIIQDSPLELNLGQHFAMAHLSVDAAQLDPLAGISFIVSFFAFF